MKKMIKRKIFSMLAYPLYRIISLFKYFLWEEPNFTPDDNWTHVDQKTGQMWWYKDGEWRKVNNF